MEGDPGATHGFDHSQMLEVIVRLEEGVAGVELDENTADAPDVAGKGPPQTEDDLGGPIMARRHDGRMIFVVKGRGAKIDESDVGTSEDFPLSGTPRGSELRRWYPPVICESVASSITEEDVLGLQVGMDEI